MKGYRKGLFPGFCCSANGAVVAPVFGNETIGYDAAPGIIASKTFSHTQDIGDDGHLVVVVCLDGGYNGVTATYNGVSMTKTDTLQDATGFGGFGADIVIFELDDPATGANDVVISFGAAYGNQELVWHAMSFTGCSGIVQTSQNDTTAATIETTFSSDITENSTIFAAAVCRGTLTSGQEVEIPKGSPQTLKQGPVAAPGVNAGQYASALIEGRAAGSLTIETNHDSADDGGIIGLEIGGL